MRLSLPSLRSHSRPRDRAAGRSLAEVDWTLFDFVDLGCSEGDSLGWARRSFKAGKGLGVDLDPTKVAHALEAGFDAVIADPTKLDARDAVRFVSMIDFLDRLADLEAVETSIERAAAVATDFLVIRHPSFEGEGFVEQLGVRQSWWHWSGHTAHPQVADYCSMFERLGLDQYVIRYRDPVTDSDHPSILPVDAPIDQHGYDAALHSPKPRLRFPRPLWRAQDILVALRPFSSPDWATIVAAVDG